MNSLGQVTHSPSVPFYVYVYFFKNQSINWLFRAAINFTEIVAHGTLKKWFVHSKCKKSSNCNNDRGWLYSSLFHCFCSVGFVTKLFFKVLWQQKTKQNPSWLKNWQICIPLLVTSVRLLLQPVSVLGLES